MKLAFHFGPRKELIWKLVSFLVTWRTRGPFDHVEVIFDDGITASASISHNGIKFIKDKDHPAESWVVVSIDEDEEQVREWFTRHQDSKFDVWGVLGFLLGFTKGNDCRWFCSEAVAASLNFPEPWRFDPNTLFAAIHRQ